MEDIEDEWTDDEEWDHKMWRMAQRSKHWSLASARTYSEDKVEDNDDE